MVTRGCGALLVVACIAWFCVAWTEALFRDLRAAKDAVKDQVLVAKEHAAYAKASLKENANVAKEKLSQAREKAVHAHTIFKEKIPKMSAGVIPGAGTSSVITSSQSAHDASQEVPPV